MGVLDHAFVGYLIAQWIFFSSTIILFNKYILSGLNFPYPATLVMLHMLFASACTTIAAAAGWVEVPHVPLAQWVRQILPVGLCFSISLALGNAAYLFISVAFVQMLKASTPVAVLLCSFAVGLEGPTSACMLQMAGLEACTNHLWPPLPAGYRLPRPRARQPPLTAVLRPAGRSRAAARRRRWALFGFILLISVGIATACLNEVQISVPGVIVQMAAVVAEAFRLCLVNLLMHSKGLKLSSFATLHYIAPACALCLLPPWAFLEALPLARLGFAPLRHVGAALLTLNASVVVCLNLSTMALIKHTSALTLNVSGVFKDIGLIGWSVVVSGALVTSMQYVGYTIALVGVTGYSHYKRTQAAAAKVDPVTVETQPLKSSEEGQSVGQDLRQHSEVAPATPDGRQVHVGIK